jgi:acyl carrier protein phosphodiesterase
MNYLAHAYLSFNHPSILLGNMMADFVKGKQQFNYPSLVHKGIVLHRAIDAFTDNHAATKAAALLFKPQYRLYAPIFIDIVYDHFLATDTLHFPNNSLLPFSEQVYQHLDTPVAPAPASFTYIYPFMKKHNWLYNYRTTAAIQKSFEGVVRRATYLSESAIAFDLFLQHYHQLQQYYLSFFPELKKAATTKFQQLLQQ